jgi:uncharacterized protein with FMN-binding domain
MVANTGTVSRQIAILKFGAILGLVLTAASCSGNRAVLREVRSMELAPVDIAGVPDGTYVGTFTYLSSVQTVRVHVANGTITRIDVLDGSDTNHGLRGRTVLDRVIAEQRVNVDAVGGATTTSKAYLKAVERALTNQ